MKNIDWENVQEAAERSQVPPGGYTAVITAVEDRPEQEGIKIELDIARGEWKGYFKELYDAKDFWGLTSWRSYKEKARPFFKGFLTAVQNSNRGYVFDNNEQSLVGKLVGVVLQEEEYTKRDGSKGTRLNVVQFMAASKIDMGSFQVPDMKRLTDGDPSKVKPIVNITKDEPDFVEITGDDDIPF